jgi:hypothetical protein
MGGFCANKFVESLQIETAAARRGPSFMLESSLMELKAKQTGGV